MGKNVEATMETLGYVVYDVDVFMVELHEGP